MKAIFEGGPADGTEREVGVPPPMTIHVMLPPPAIDLKPDERFEVNLPHAVYYLQRGWQDMTAALYRTEP
jgi:hypothetical protein